MKVLSICKTVKKKHKTKKKWKKRKVNKSLARKVTTIALDKIQFIFSEMTGNCFWTNYYNAFQWRNNYLNFWNASNNFHSMQNVSRKSSIKIKKKSKRKQKQVKGSCSNDVQDCIRDLNCITLDSTGESSQNNFYPSNDDCDDNCSEGSNSLEVSEEMIKFMEINMRHRAELEAEKEKWRKLRKQAEAKEKPERDDIEECNVPIEAALNKCRSEEMNNLYGKSAPMIHGMETAIQLTFNWNCDHHKPEYWPNLPFAFKFANN